MHIIRAIVFLFVFLLFSCTKEKVHLKILKVTEHSSSQINQSDLVNLLESENNISIDIFYTLYEDSALNRLRNGDVDLLIIPNNINSLNNKFRLLAPLLPRFLIIYTNQRTEISDLKLLLQTSNVYFEDRSKLDSVFFDKLYYNYNIDKQKINTRKLSQLNIDNKSDSLEVYVGLTHINNKFIKKMADSKWSLFSLDNVDNYRKGSKVEGFTLMNTFATPFLIPMYIYKGKPETSILTMSIKDILICRKEMPEELAYNIVKTLVQNKSQLIHKDHIYNFLDFDYSSQVWAFPLHKGAERFVDRDKPSEWLKWIRMIWPIISISVVLIGAFSSIRSMLRKKSRHSIELYYQKVNSINRRIDEVNSVKEINLLMQELNMIKANAIETLANNKFISSQSFNIFLLLYSEINQELKEKLLSIK